MDEIRNDGLLMDQPMLDEPDALEGEDPQVSPEQFVEYVTQSRRHGRGAG